MGHVRRQLRQAETPGVFRAEGSCHVQPVQPHLIGQAGLVPEAALGIAGHVQHFLIHAFQAFFVEGIARALQQGKEQDAGLDIVQISMDIVFDAAVCIEHGVDPILYILEVTLLAAQAIGFVHAGKEHPLVIVKVSLGRQIGGGKAPHQGIAGGAGVFQGRFHGGSSFKKWAGQTIFFHYTKDGGI